MHMKNVNYTQRTVNRDVATGKVIVLDLHHNVFICILIMKLINCTILLERIIDHKIFLK